MKQIPRAMLDRYTELINGVSGATQSAVKAQLEALRTATPKNIADVLKTSLRAADLDVSEVDRQFYQMSRKLMLGDAGEFDLITDELYNDAYFTSATEKMVTKATVDGAIDSELLASYIDTFVGQVVNSSSKRRMRDYGKRDSKKPKWARIPNGSETCAWCIALAGRGFYYMSENQASHSHDGCDCVIMPGWGKGANEAGHISNGIDDADFTVEGYAPYKYWSLYSDAKADVQDGTIDEPEYFEGYLAAMRKKYGLK